MLKTWERKGISSTFTGKFGFSLLAAGSHHIAPSQGYRLDDAYEISNFVN